MKCLITGFEPFGNDSTNPSWDAVQLLPDQIDGIEIIKLQIPTIFEDCLIPIREAIAIHQPDAIICVGQAGGRTAISLEKVAINLQDARIPDNANNQSIDQPIVAHGPAAYFSTLPLRAMISAMHKKGIPAYVSYSAGTFVCNDVMYRLLHMLADDQCIGGFIHVPYTLHQVIDKSAAMSSMSLEAIAKGLQCAIEALATGSDKEECIQSMGSIQ